MQGKIISLASVIHYVAVPFSLSFVYYNAICLPR